eukprot:TRINITY_DN51936_c0_g1_i1.p1 TRINITY_DN51936_c0_g1~~TRINITY_DN51936_c0_g1_i1.p1  ORF type:complete len:187 (+),score=51.54 TRINITY_DN51936_c0_g1_i1:90-650(+)
MGGTDKLWEVIGGGSKGGILVRQGKKTSSAQFDRRLATGSLVRQVALEDVRLNYELVRGQGPQSGWVSISLNDKPLLRIQESTDAKPLPEATQSELLKLTVKELKDEIQQAGFSFAGAAEKEDLVRLVQRARAHQHLGEGFVATEEWQKVPEGMAVPPGIEVRFDLEKGCNYARLPPVDTSRKKGG